MGGHGDGVWKVSLQAARAALKGLSMALKEERERGGRERGLGLAVLLGRPCVSQPTAFLSSPRRLLLLLLLPCSVLSSDSIFNEINN